MFNGVEIDTGSETTSFNISRQISSADYGVYTCSASNEFGSDSESIEIIQAGKIDICILYVYTDIDISLLKYYSRSNTRTYNH